ncbi:MAG: TVP38/TMEM64 family protein [Verrucomicrobiales bacterium]|nr:TVP38/TMEM64 family protein [Verrucomicrobiales bacterium]|tara:strand:- start:4155 stop:4916 length:762 start_codon:yes stop_codon:yes gene_type:complete
MNSPENTESTAVVAEAKQGNPAIKLIVLTIFAGLAFWFWRNFGHTLNFEYLAGKETAMRNYAKENPALVIGIAFGIYVAITGLSLPGALVITLVVGWFFKFWQGLLLVSFASTAGATIAFLFSRFLLRDSIQSKFGDRLKTFNEALDREGPFYLFTLRVIPAVPFFVINLVMGLTPIRTGTFWWVSQVGMLPGTAAFVYAGSQVPSLNHFVKNGASGTLSPGLIAAFVILGLLPFVMRKVVARFKKAGSPTNA